MHRADEQWMRLALGEAEKAASRNEVPVGAILVGQDNRMIAACGNGPIGANDPTAHAEILVIREAARILNNYRLVGTSLYVTLEPCIMCMGAMLHARIDRLVYGAVDPKTGAAHSLYQLGCDTRLNHRIEVSGEVLAPECAAIIRAFFRSRRKA